MGSIPVRGTTDLADDLRLAHFDRTTEHVFIVRGTLALLLREAENAKLLHRPTAMEQAT